MIFVYFYFICFAFVKFMMPVVMFRRFCLFDGWKE